MSRLLDSRVMFWVIAIAWVILTPFFIGIMLWHFLITTPSEMEAVHRRQMELLRDDRDMLANQKAICKAVHADCSFPQEPGP